MNNDTLPELPLELGIYLEKPYGGLFGNSVLTRILEEIVSDPYQNYHPKDLEEIVNASSPSIRKSLSALTSIGILEKDEGKQKHPVYRANIDSKRLMALTFLSYAMLDDRDKTNCMDEAIIDYCYRYRLIDKIMPVAEATFMQIKYYSGRTESVKQVKLEDDTQVVEYLSQEA